MKILWLESQEMLLFGGEQRISGKIKLDTKVVGILIRIGDHPLFSPNLHEKTGVQE